MTRPPFVLIDRGDAAPALLYEAPRSVLEARDPDAVADGLERLRGAHAAGFLSYEAGHALEPKLRPLCAAPAAADPPLLWFGLFDPPREAAVDALLPDGAGAWAGPARPTVAHTDYEAQVERALDHIRAGDIYQANLTFRAEVRTAGDPLALYAAARRRARAGHGGIVFTGTHWVLSFSPELFFTLENGRVATRPMKGTAPAGSDPEALRSDPKQRAENLMIVDLLRNDLSRLARPGTVKVPELFAVETYPTVLQMTSTVTAELEGGAGAVELLRAIHPCGSVTGAPKIRAMEIIHGLEAGPRGVYTGAIGRIAPDGEAAFNVAIRTLVLRAGETVARLGLGSGIVADSRPDEEWRECLAKGRFVETERRFDLVETMRFDPHAGIVDLERHLERMKASAAALDFEFDRHDARNELQAATFRVPPAKVRLMLARSGAMAIEVAPLPPPPGEPVAVALAPRPVEAGDFRLVHKTTDRPLRRADGAFETLFVDAEGFLTEGSFTSLFVEQGGMLATPPLARGLMPGVLRARLIEEGKAQEAELRPDNLSAGFLIGNAVRGLVRARLAGEYGP